MTSEGGGDRREGNDEQEKENREPEGKLIQAYGIPMGLMVSINTIADSFFTALFCIEQ